MGKGKQFGYLCCDKSNFGHLKKEVEKLRERRERVQHMVGVAKENGEEIEQSVENWLISVDRIVDEAVKFVEDDEEAKKQCFKGLCLNFMNWYRLSKKAARSAKAVVELLEEGKFDQVSYRAISSGGYVSFESRKSILNDVLDALSDPDVNMIGLHGVSGIGKTTLVKEVARQVKEDKLFDEVVFAEVSQTPDVKRIREEIADQLGLSFCEGSEYERAMVLCDRLRNEKKILVILDNIWTSLDLERVGIPLGDKCKVLLTSTRLSVLSNDMGSQKNFFVSILTEEEAWRLFQKMAGDCISNVALQSLAIDVASTCAYLPIAIVLVARALRNKSVFDWKDGLSKLRTSAKSITEVVYSTIELSFNHLDGEELKSTFLLCVLMKYPYAPIMDLLKYGVGLGLFNNTNTLEETRDRLLTLVHELKDSCLLYNGHTSEWFCMHDVVRDVAISIASRKEHVFILRNEVVLREWPGKDTLKICTAISLHDCKVMELPEWLECPQLKFFYMNVTDRFLKIPDNFFTGMTELSVLVLTKMHLLSLPSSFHLLINLQTLCLDQCILGDIANIANLKKLRVLSFCGSDIEQLPREIGQLSHLRLLDLSNCPKLRVISPNVLSSLSQLEELYMGNTFVEWEFEGLNSEGRSASLNELKHLCRLTTLEIHILDAKIFPKGLFSGMLKRYKIFIGDEWDWYAKCDNTRTLKLKLNTNICLANDVVMQLKGIEDLYLDEVKGVKTILCKLEKEAFLQLKQLHVQNNRHILFIVDPVGWVSLDIFPLLESLFLCNLINLEKICHGQLKAGALCRLRSIEVRNCDKLENIFSFSTARNLQLQTIKVIKCENMKEIFVIQKEDKVNSNKMIDKIEFDQLRSLTLKFLPQLTSFCSKRKTSSKSSKRPEELKIGTGSTEVILKDGLNNSLPLFDEKVVFPNLEALELCAISFDKIWDNEYASCFLNLTRLIVKGCDKLKYLFTSSIVRKFSQLQHLEICYCKVLEEIVAKEGEAEAEATAVFVFQRVTFLKLWNLSELKTFYPGLHISEWPELKRLEVHGCDKIKTFASESRSFSVTSKKGQLHIPVEQTLFLVEKIIPSLEELKLSGKDFKLIWQSRFPEDLFCKLKILEVVNDYSETIPLGFLQRFHNLEKLELKCSSYKEIFSCKHVDLCTGMHTLLRSLKLWQLPDLEYIWKQGSKLDPISQNLEILEVWWCDNLINLVPSSTFFQNLTVLEVWYCKQLVNLFTPSMAKSLVRLVKMRVDRCQMVVEIIANEGDVAEDEIIFSKLKWLSFEHLENFTSFCSGNYICKFPSLVDLYVIECPKMKIFSPGVLSMPMLQEVQQKRGLDKGSWELDLNTTVQKLHKGKQESDVLQQPQIDQNMQEWLTSSVAQAQEQMIQMQSRAKNNPFAIRSQLFGRDIEHTSTNWRGRGRDDQAMDVSESVSELSLKERKSEYQRTVRVYAPQIPVEDGYTWRKYGQKEILLSKFPRSYFRCNYQNSRGCRARKKVQQLSDDPVSFEIAYYGEHTCRNSLETISVPRTVRADAPQIPVDDGYTWRKYGQKEILGSKFPRSYFRCHYQNSRGCRARKQVQQLSDDPVSFEIVYCGEHTCRNSLETISVPRTSDESAQEMLFREQQESDVPQQPQIDQNLQECLKASVAQAQGQMIERQLPAKKNPFAIRNQMAGKNIEHTSTNWRGRGRDDQAMDVSESVSELSLKERKSEYQRTVRADAPQIPVEDGYTWRKYGQKEILGSKFPRSYYRCNHQNSRGCLAKKKVQQLSDDPGSFKIVYCGEHTCQL